MACSSLRRVATSVGAIVALGSITPYLAQTPTADAGGVTGSIYTPVFRDRVGEGSAAGGTERLYVPQFEVYLARQPGNVPAATAKTDLYGRYIFQFQPAGQYRVCWSGAG